ncbi:hypothetical protein [Amycolatopsis samaneae]|uniref:Uncharacterized protein n=1 Tax=Amycolatopsis samaneae TaxID=664691 RepID=A0ABW5GVZ9_9PSEU
MDGQPRFAAFTDERNWCGGFYELDIELGAPDDARLERALSALCQVSGVERWYASKDREPADQTPVPVTLAAFAESNHLYSTIRLPGGATVVCGCFVSRGEDGPDRLDFYLPLGALARTDRRIGGFPFGPSGGEGSLTWRNELDGWLAGLAIALFGRVPFRLAVLGFEPDVVESADLAGGLPAERWDGYVLPGGDGPRYVPANR